jgi:1-acyl-sn-glycerol-3-phosphate acyltransferase
MDAPRISRPLLALFRYIVRGYFRRHFHAVRLHGIEHFAAASQTTGPLILYANHIGWWDPMVAFLLAEKFMPARRHFAPMDADALERYEILKHIGVFPVEMNTGRGAVQFLRTGESIATGGGVLWVTPQGKFVDPRETALEFKPGLAALAARVAASAGACRVLPLAIEYTFWDERLPECLLLAREPLHVSPAETAESIEARLLSELQLAMQELKQMVMRRDASLFETIAHGRVGPGGFYALGQRLKAMFTRQPYRPEHTIAPIVREGHK